MLRLILERVNANPGPWFQSKSGAVGEKVGGEIMNYQRNGKEPYSFSPSYGKFRAHNIQPRSTWLLYIILFPCPETAKIFQSRHRGLLPFVFYRSQYSKASQGQAENENGDSDKGSRLCLLDHFLLPCLRGEILSREWAKK